MFYTVSKSDDINEVVRIARIIWTEHYTPIIGMKQVEYMLTNLHSKEVISRQMTQENYHYYLIKNNNNTIGYIGAQVKEQELFLSKFYLELNSRGKGTGKTAMDFIKELARQYNLNKITLTVNKYNHNTISAYHKLGFVKTDEVSVDIGENFKMEDLLMELPLL